MNDLEIEGKWYVPKRAIIDQSQMLMSAKHHLLSQWPLKDLPRLRTDITKGSFGVISTEKSPLVLPGSTAQINREYEQEVTNQELLETLFSNLRTPCLVKHRFDIIYGDKLIQLDFFRGNLADLIVAEVEFETVEDEARFAPPNYFGVKVSGMKEWSSRSLALRDQMPANFQQVHDDSMKMLGFN